MAKPAWTGVYPALLTPFTKDDQIDLELFGKNLKAQIDAGVSGVIIGGTLGEASTLEHGEIISMLEYAKSNVAADFPVVVNVAEGSTRNAIRAAQNIQAHGADGIMLLPPMRYKSDDAETVAFFSAVATSISLPVMVYNNPVDYKIEVTLPMFEQLAKIENIQSVKESTRDVSNVTRMKNTFGDRFKILCGVDTLTLEEIALGADGLVAGLVDAFPAETVAIFNLMKAGRYEEALKIYRWFLPLLELDIVPKLVQYIKLAATQTGIGSEYVRAPRQMISGTERERVLDIINRGLANRPQLPDYRNL
ncbi:MAG TPA: dihydrodipicolinate synthase family protein [Saprospiraceae bacterium]|jgi:4-hydroxy-tetrahydrodipicolinate synthase|nr:MAG: dihydrodipicolinate synthase [Candidatus Parvibacillus calidus]MBX2937144.1 dihydrodipicolinate synthase family protein [Saprospiraceae bacterium]MBK7741278.1 dihydrodipicolinate synthase family protein [Candidatus Parvibacillus calidus]MBX7178601.1 dihydrodipicolinate synthase family protein [Saprospiraceae bacterium]MCC7149244.1 dihydrodipicolinate synthase family protein [Saprospiraceae bacterium]